MLDDRTDRVRSLSKSFRDAFRGVCYCVRNERNMRIHLTVAGYVLVFSVFYHLSALEYSLLFLVIGFVLFAEAVNTALEAAVNLHTQSYDSLARIAKDVAAGGVLVSAAFAAVIGCILFLKPAVLLSIVRLLAGRPLWGGLFLISLPLAGFFVFCFPFGVRRRRR